MIHNVVFDFGQVMVRFDPQYMVERYVKDPADAALLSEVVFDRLYWDRLDAGSISDEEVMVACRERLPERLHAVAEQIYYNWIYNLPLIEGMPELIDELRARYDVGIYLLSNISTYFSTHRKDIEVLKKFDGCVFSGDLGIVKPDAKIFSHLCDRFDINKEECIFVDDSQKNIDGAIRFGLQGYCFDGNVKKLRETLFALLSPKENQAAKPIATLPIGENLSYFCTWATQNRVGERNANVQITSGAFTGEQGASHAREQMNEEFLFGKEGVAYLWEDVRSELYLILDDGWDVPYGIDPATQLSLFGSQIINEKRFPSLTGSPAQRLKQMRERAVAAGWRGLGIWVAPQKAGMERGEHISFADIRTYWQERLEWSKYAGVRYWKVDWGMLSAPEYRKCLTDLAAEVYPELYVEQAKCTYPLNGVLGTEQIRFANSPNQAERTARVYEESRVFRSYDVTDDRLSATTTLDRLSFLLSRERGGWINCEDELYIGAALGCSVGIMRSHFGSEEFGFCRRLQEVNAAVRWLKIAPPFAGGSYTESEKLLYDTCHFEKGDTWFADAHGKTVTQAAPAVMARNTPLPEVKAGDSAPFVIASYNPVGAYAVAAIRRYQYGDHTDAPDVTCFVGACNTVGIFGHFASITLRTEQAVTRVMAQSLLDMHEWDITSDIRIIDGAIVIDGTLLTSLARANDESEPAVKLTFLS